MERHYGYEDVFIVPRYSEVLSRRDVDTSVKLGDVVLKVPVISANMDTITEDRMSEAMHMGGGIGAQHRFLTPEEQVGMFQRTRDPTFVSVGASGDWELRAVSLLRAGARLFIIDIAHGHSLRMKRVLKWFKAEKVKHRTLFVIAGNVTTQWAVNDLALWGADAVKVGLAGGYVCATKDVTGVMMPMFSAIQTCSKGARVPIIADGGIRSPGDIAKALGAGASAVMSGWMFAGCEEVPHRARRHQKVSFYRGMASAGAMATIKGPDDSLPTPEGIEVVVENKGSAVQVVESIAGGLRSAFSYVGARNLEEFQRNVTFGVKV